jgi:hypothetical protein
MVVVWNSSRGKQGNTGRINRLKQYFSSIAIQRLCLLFLLSYRLILAGFEVNISMGQIAEHLFRNSFALGIISRYALIKLKENNGFKLNMYYNPQ